MLSVASCMLHMQRRIVGNSVIEIRGSRWTHLRRIYTIDDTIDTDTRRIDFSAWLSRYRYFTCMAFITLSIISADQLLARLLARAGLSLCSMRVMALQNVHVGTVSALAQVAFC